MRIQRRLPAPVLILALALPACAGPRAMPSSALSLERVPRVPPDRVRARVASGAALLVCAFEAEDRCDKKDLPQALTLAELEARAARLPRNTELIFYCACAGDSTALRVATAFHRRGWTNVKVLKGGPAAWTGAPDLL